MAEKMKIVIEVDSKTGIVNMKQFGKSGDKVTDSMKRQEKAAKSLTGSLKGVVAALGGFVALRTATRWVDEFVEAAGKQQQAVAGMEQAMRSMGRYSPKLYDELIALAQGLQEVTTFGDEATIEGMKFLLTYKGITDELLPRTTKAMLDLAAMMGGDTRQAANMLGKASMGLSGELRKCGVTIDENIAKTGDFGLILGEIEKQVKGQAEALAKTGYGGLQQVKALWGDLEEKFGGVILMIGQNAGVFDELKKQILGVSGAVEAWVGQNDRLIKQKIPEHVEKIKSALGKVWDILSYDPAIIEWGLIGLAIGGRKGAAIIGGLAHMKTWAENLYTAFNLAAQGIVSFSEIATANFKELEELVNRSGSGPFFRGKIPKRTPSPAPDRSGWGEPSYDYMEMEMQLTSDLYNELLRRNQLIFGVEQVKADILGEMRGAQAEKTFEPFQYEHDYALQLAQDRVYQEIELERRLESEKMMIRTAGLNFLSATGEAMINITMKQGKAQFAMQKGLQVGMAVMAAWLAHNKALASGLGPPSTIPLAQAVLKQGLLGAAAIAAASIGQIAAGAGGGGGGGGEIAAPTYPAYTPAYYGEQKAGVLEIHIDTMIGDEAYVEMLAEKISEAVENREVRLVASDATRLRD